MSLGRPSVMASLGERWHGLEAAQRCRSLGVRGGGVLSTGLKLLHSPRPTSSQPRPCTPGLGSPPSGQALVAPCTGTPPRSTCLRCPTSLWLCLSCSWGVGGRQRPGPGPGPAHEPPGWAACLHGSIHQAWAGVGRQWALSAAVPPRRSFPGCRPTRQGCPLPPNAWLGAAAACVPCHRRTCFPATLCLCC